VRGGGKGTITLTKIEGKEPRGVNFILLKKQGLILKEVREGRERGIKPPRANHQKKHPSRGT